MAHSRATSPAEGAIAVRVVGVRVGWFWVWGWWLRVTVAPTCGAVDGTETKAALALGCVAVGT
jgi:hypothetical protein